MRRQFAVLCATGFVGLVAFSPVLAASASSSTAAAKKPPKSSASSSSTTNTSGKAPSKKSSTTPSTASQGSPSQGSPSQGSSACGTPQTAHEPAPAQGASQNYPAANAGAVDVQRASQSDLKVGNVTANTGWTYKVITASGPRISVRFINQATPSSAVHFAAQMDQAGRDIHVRVTSC